MSTLTDRIRVAIAGTPREFWPKVVATHAQAGAWELCEALTALRELQDPTPCGAPPQTRWRLPPRTRRNRWEERPVLPSQRWVRAMNLDPAVDWALTDGAVRCLQLVMSLAGGAGRPFVTLTSSIAKQLGRVARTVQNYWHELVDRGLLQHTFNRKTGLVTLIVTEAVEPPPVPEAPQPWPRLPNPRKGWRPRISRWGAKMGAHIKPKAAKPALLEADVQAAEAVFGGHPQPS